MKRLRRKFGKVRFYHCGEYGDKNGRPHYHASIFNYNFPDQFQIGVSKSGHPLFTSKALLDLWPPLYRDWETDRKSTRLNSSHLKLTRMPSSA